ncbi:MAG: GNAT family N-acetyltransferase [Rhizobiales bacterium]|nr:GNAT family N-acetyltransferase [Hyphomicrobiales bacterium]
MDCGVQANRRGAAWADAVTGEAATPPPQPSPARAGEGAAALPLLPLAGEGRGGGASATSFTLREATPADLPDILRLVRDLADYEKLLHEAVGTEADFREALFSAHPRVFCTLAEREGAIVGQAIWFYNFSTFTGRPGIYLEDIFVMPERRASGIGLAFFRHLAARAVAENCTRMEWQVLDWNEPAIRFYDRIGSVTKDEWRARRISGAALRNLARKQ